MEAPTLHEARNGLLTVRCGDYSSSDLEIRYRTSEELAIVLNGVIPSFEYMAHAACLSPLVGEFREPPKYTNLHFDITSFIDGGCVRIYSLTNPPVDPSTYDE